MRPIISVLLAVSVCTSASIAEERIDKKEANPATFYTQTAEALLPLGKERKSLLRDIASGSVDYQHKALVGLDIELSKALLLKASESAAPCDWRLAWEDGLGMSASHLTEMVDLSTISLVIAEARFSEGKVAEGIQMLMVAHHIARDAGAGDLLIGNVTQNSIEQNVVKAVARHCLKWNDSIRAEYARKFEALPELHKLHDAYANEEKMIEWIEVQLLKDPASIEEQFGKQAVEEGIDFAEVMFGLALCRGMIDDAVSALKLDGEAREKAIEEFDAKYQSSENMLVKIFMPNLAGVARAEDRVAASHDMLRLALEHGPEMDGKSVEHPLEFSKTDYGYELSFDEDSGIQFHK